MTGAEYNREQGHMKWISYLGRNREFTEKHRLLKNLHTSQRDLWNNVNHKEFQQDLIKGTENFKIIFTWKENFHCFKVEEMEVKMTKTHS